MFAPFNLGHMKEGIPLLRAGMILAGVVGLLCIGGGIAAIIWNIQSPTEISFFEVTVTTGEVGVALALLGVAALVVVIRAAYKRLVELGRIP